MKRSNQALMCLAVMLIISTLIACAPVNLMREDATVITTSPVIDTEVSTTRDDVSMTEIPMDVESQTEAAVAEEPDALTATIDPCVEINTLEITTPESEWICSEDASPEENIFVYLTDHLGYSNAAACGIIANIAHETGWKFNPDAGSSDYSYGLIQWMGGRLSNLKKWCKKNDKDYKSVQGQLDFMDWELQNADPYGTYEHLMECEDSQDGAYDAAWYFCYWYERPANKKARSRARGNDAEEYYATLVLNGVEA